MSDLPVYLINLDGSDERLRSASGQLNHAGQVFQRVPAFDGRKLRVDQFLDYDAGAALRYLGRPMRGGEIGCYLSHLDCARRFLASGAEHCIVLEDDMQLQPGYAEGVRKVLAWLGRQDLDWDLINIGANRHKIYTAIHEFDAGGQQHALTRAHYFPMTTTALIWSRQGARAFVAEHGAIFAAVDNYFRHWLTRTDRGLAVWPPLVTTTGAESEIAGAGRNRRSAEGRHPLYGLLKQRRLLTDKFIAWRHKRRAARTS
ncbi:glycosyltransferase family 25 protein [Paracoccus sp. PXZ]|uniref:glycosyltransferase family 25 protein n=1 Tax=Paracoccus sp. MKU1 TaxID=1745182 RepID=UPI0007194023|nr:glycosyltransferase family 25 protein [Paracoccus sp. MKU1]KRW95547.1 hypothetical protein AQY21_14065 [Paracoccus sp. MKU1]